MRMKAVAKTEPAPGLTLIDAPVPQPRADEVLIKVRAAAICGTDVHIYKWDPWSAKHIQPPRIIGHEFAGEIVACGELVQGLRPGLCVSAEGHIVTARFRDKHPEQQHLDPGASCIGISRNGCFAEYLTVPQSNVWVNPPEVPVEIAALQDPFGNAVHTATAFDLAGKHVLVTGCGPIGLMAVMLARVYGAATVLATDVSEQRLKLARQLGADEVFVADGDEVVQTIRDHTDGGADVLLEMSGAGAGIRQGLEALRAGGEAAVLGLIGRELQLDWDELVVLKGVTLKGIYGRRMFDTWHRMRGLLRSGAVDLRPLITHELPLEAFDEAFEKILHPGQEQVAKIVLRP